MNICVVCDKEIPQARLKILPETNLCSAKCVETTKDKIEVLEEKIQKNKIEEINEINREKIGELYKKKNSCIFLYKKFQNNQISEDEYITGFKKFTWWIKEIVEKHGGYLIDNPTKYTRCLKCFSLSIVLWSGKNNNYFIGCTKFYKGCKWAKSIWSLE